MKTNKLVGARLDLRCAVNATESQESEAPRFKMVGYTGAVMEVCYHDLPLIIDLNGIEPRSQKIPILKGHSFYSGVGHTDKIEVVDGNLVAEGVVSRQTPEAVDFAASSKLGCPWQASVGGLIVESEQLKPQETRTVNGRNVVGPLEIVTKFDLYEISVVEYGADGATEASVQCSLVLPQGKKQMTEENNNVPQPDSQPFPKPINAGGNPAPNPPQPPAPNPINAGNGGDSGDSDVDEWLAKRRQVAAAELLRVQEIQKRGEGKDLALEAQAISEGWSPDKFELEFLRANRPTAPAVHTPEPRVEPEALVIAARRASGQSVDESQYSEKQLEAADQLGGVGLREFIEIACGRPLPRFRQSHSDWVRAAFSTSELGYVLTRAANSSLIDGFNYVEAEWRKIAKISSVNDFKEHERYRMNSSFQFERMTEGGKFKHGEIGDEKFGIKAYTEGTMFAITREMIKNDDLGALTEIPRNIGMGAADAINRTFWTTFLSPPNASDGTAYYSTSHKNQLAGNPLDISGLTAANVEFLKKTRPKPKGSTEKAQPLGVRPSILVVPPELYDKALMLVKATTLNETTTTGKASPANYNPHVGRYEVVTSSFLSDTNFNGNSTTAYYLLADPRRVPAFEVAFLDGKDRPTIERAEASFDCLGIEFRGYIDYGVRQQDWRGILKVAGTT